MKFILYFTISIAVLHATDTVYAQPLSPLDKVAEKQMTGPVVYVSTNAGTLYKIDIMTCEVCFIGNITGFSGDVFDILVLPNGDILANTLQGLRRYTLPNPNPVWTNNTTIAGGSIIGANGTIYLTSITPNGLSSFNPATNTVTYLGNWPPGVNIQEFFYQNGILYGYGQQIPNTAVFQINLVNPGLTMFVNFSIGGMGASNGGTTNNGYTTEGPAAVFAINQYDVTTNTLTQLCNLTGSIISLNLSGMTDLPVGVPEKPCLCTVFAGTVSPDLFNVCTSGVVNVPYLFNASYTTGETINFILFSNPNDTLGSIIATSSNPVFSFNPSTMQTGVTYYLASIVGDNLNGNVSLNDPCLDISNTAAQVIWRDPPTVSFSLAGGNNNVCAGDCIDVEATFTGTPPYFLVYTAYGTPFSLTAFSNSASFQVCIPPGTPTGPVMVTANNLISPWCSACN